ncbi:MAG: hypothetical protein GKR90_12060 [Pseudomonadales bacterium]|nr:hypothetical protein [Pseudomonadales bacterium]
MQHRIQKEIVCPVTVSKSIVCLVITLLIALCAVSATAMPSNPGIPVKKILHASQIDTWLVLDNSRLIVSRPAAKNYLVTLRRECHELGFAHSVGLSSSNNTVYAGFDYVTVGAQRCAIQSINQISPAQKADLTRS